MAYTLRMPMRIVVLAILLRLVGGLLRQHRMIARLVVVVMKVMLQLQPHAPLL
jgi:hypothetical protein